MSKRLPSSLEVAEGTYEATVASEELKAFTDPLMKQLQATSELILSDLKRLNDSRELILEGMSKGILNTKQELTEVNAWIQVKEQQATKLRDLAQSILDKINKIKKETIV